MRGLALIVVWSFMMLVSMAVVGVAAEDFLVDEAPSPAVAVSALIGGIVVWTFTMLVSIAVLGEATKDFLVDAVPEALSPAVAVSRRIVLGGSRLTSFLLLAADGLYVASLQSSIKRKFRSCCSIALNPSSKVFLTFIFARTFAGLDVNVDDVINGSEAIERYDWRETESRSGGTAI